MPLSSTIKPDEARVPRRRTSTVLSVSASSTSLVVTLMVYVTAVCVAGGLTCCAAAVLAGARARIAAAVHDIASILRVLMSFPFRFLGWFFSVGGCRSDTVLLGLLT